MLSSCTSEYIEDGCVVLLAVFRDTWLSVFPCGAGLLAVETDKLPARAFEMIKGTPVTKMAGGLGRIVETEGQRGVLKSSMASGFTIHLVAVVSVSVCIVLDGLPSKTILSVQMVNFRRIRLHKHQE